MSLSRLGQVRRFGGGGWPGRWPRSERARIKTAPLLNQYDVRDINAVSFKCVGRRWRSGWPSPKRVRIYFL